jgi:hypothetical protein
MPMRRVHTTPFPMDRGIEKILHAEDLGVEGGPVADISPAYSPLKPRLEQLYALPNLEDYIAGQLAPLILETSLLLPHRFENALRGGVDDLEAEAEEDPRNARILRRAARLMGDQVSLRDLLRMYRLALLKG